MSRRAGILANHDGSGTWARCRLGATLVVLVMAHALHRPGALAAQDTSAVRRVPTGADSASVSIAPRRVDVRPQARDEEIGRRLQSVLEATDWFANPSVRVESGVVFLEGSAPSEQLRAWAGDLARNTEGVVAVANRMIVPPPSIWDFGPASRGLVTLWRDILRALPSLAFGIVVLLLSSLIAALTGRGARYVLRNRVGAKLLRTVLARAAGAFVLLIGVYVILRVIGLTQLALTVVGGTGLIGLAVGIAFRDITENFLASVFLSIQRPFEPADLIEVAGVTGYVQQLNMRTTVIMNLDGNVVQIPNAAVYKSNLRNYSTNCNRREFFDIGIGYDDVISHAQEIARRVLDEHPAVLDDPAPAVLVDTLGASTVNIRVYFWLDGRENSWLKVRSSVIRLVKREFQRQGISMPDAAREIIFPQGVPVRQIGDEAAADRPVHAEPASSPHSNQEAAATQAEGGLHSEAATIEAQARRSRTSNDDENLLTPDQPAPPSSAASDAGTALRPDRP